MTRPVAVRDRDERGAVAILVAVSSLVLFGMAALVVDLGSARDMRRASQNASDASALAAANVLYLDPTTKAATSTPQFAAAVAAAKSYAKLNYGVTDWSTCTDAGSLAYVYPGSPSCISFDSATQPQTVRVRAPLRRVATPFASVFKLGTTGVAVGSFAEASLKVSATAACGFCVLGSGVHDLGTGHTTVTGDVGMNGDLSVKKTFAVTGSFTLEGYTGTEKFSGWNPDPTPGIHVDDPMAGVTMPDPTGMSNKSNQNPCTGGPGVYSSFNAASSCTLSPGLYVVLGNTKVTGNNTVLSGTGVTLYFACGSFGAIVPCTAANSWNSFDFGSNKVHLNIAAPTANPVNHAVVGLAIVADRGWTGTLSFQGGGAGTSSGAIYLKSGTLSYSGNSDGTALNASIVVDDYTMNGNSASYNVVATSAGAGPLSAANLHLSK